MCVCAQVSDIEINSVSHRFIQHDLDSATLDWMRRENYGQDVFAKVLHGVSQGTITERLEESTVV